MLDEAALLMVCRERLNYDHDTGAFTWKYKSRCGWRKPGDRAGGKDSRGYYQLWIGGRHHKGHRIAWLMFYGALPNGDIDHINGDRLDNRITNLRDVDRQTNLHNLRRATKLNKCGFLGVSPNHGRWAASIKVNGQKLHLGTYDTPTQAHEVYVDAKRRHHHGFIGMEVTHA